MNNPENLGEYLVALSKGDEVTFSHEEKTNAEIANELLEKRLADMKENCRLGDGCLIPSHISFELRLLKLIVNIAKDLEGAE